MVVDNNRDSGSRDEKSEQVAGSHGHKVALSGRHRCKGAKKAATPAKAAKKKEAAPKPATSKSAAKETARPKAARESSNKAIVPDLLRRPAGATLAEIANATGWQNHSIRCSISGTRRKKMGLMVESKKNEAGERTYGVAKQRARASFATASLRAGGFSRSLRQIWTRMRSRTEISLNASKAVAQS